MQTRYSYPLTNELLLPEIQPWFASPIARETDRQSCDSIGFFVNLLPASTQLSSQPNLGEYENYYVLSVSIIERKSEAVFEL